MGPFLKSLAAFFLIFRKSPVVVGRSNSDIEPRFSDISKFRNTFVF